MVFKIMLLRFKITIFAVRCFVRLLLYLTIYRLFVCVFCVVVVVAVAFGLVCSLFSSRFIRLLRRYH